MQETLNHILALTGMTFEIRIYVRKSDCILSLTNAMGQLFEVLRYKAEGCVFDSRWTY